MNTTSIYRISQPSRSSRPARAGARLVTIAALAALLAPSLSANPAIERLVFDPQPLQDRATPTAPLSTAGTMPLLSPHARTTPIPFAPPGLAHTSVTPRDALARHEEAMATLVGEGGPYNPALREHLLDQARLLQADGDHEKAIEVLARAEHIIRVNDGLRSPGLHVPVRLSIASYRALGDFQQALDRQEYLVYLHQSLYGHDAVELVPELAALGEMYFSAFERSIAHDVAAKDLVMRFGPESGFRDVNDLTTMELAFLWLGQAQVTFSRSIKTLIDHQQYFHPMMIDLETRLISTLFLQANRGRIALDRTFYQSAVDPSLRDTLRMDEHNKRMPRYKDGVNAFDRIVAYRTNDPAARPEDVARAMLELGDWHLLFGYHKRGQQQYDRAREYLAGHGCDEARINALLAPPVPVQLPAFAAQPHSLRAVTADQAAITDYAGYIDVAFRVNESGRATDIEILDKSANADKAVQDRLLKVVTNAPYRPLIGANGDDRVALRYQFAWL